MPERKKTKKKTKKKAVKRRSHAMREGGRETLTVRTVMRDISASFTRKALRYLKVNEGDRLKVVAVDGQLIVSPVLQIDREIDSYETHKE